MDLPNNPRLYLKVSQASSPSHHLELLPPSVLNHNSSPHLQPSASNLQLSVSATINPHNSVLSQTQVSIPSITLVIIQQYLAISSLTCSELHSKVAMLALYPRGRISTKRSRNMVEISSRKLECEEVGADD